MKKIIKYPFFTMFFILLTIFLIGCRNNNHNPKEYEVTLEVFDQIHQIIFVKENEKLQVSSLPVLEYDLYNFLGWIDESGNLINKDITITKNTTLTAKLELIEHKVTLMVNDEIYQTLIFNKNDILKVNTLPVLEYDLYNFLGWTDESGELINKDITITEDLILTAELELIKYDVILMVNNEIYQTITITKNDILKVNTLPVLEYDLYNFLGWTDESGNLINTDITMTKDLILTAELELIKYDVTLMVNNTIYQVISVVKNDILKVTNLPKIEYELYNFLGWTDESGNLITKDLVLTDDITLIAELELIKYSITLYVDEEIYQTLEVTKHDVITINSLPIPEKDLYNFKGWKDENDQILKGEITITQDLILTAHFEKAITHILTINYNDMYNKEYEIVSWDQVILADYILKIDGYAFLEWEINGNVYSKEFIVVTENMTIKALYEEAPEPVHLTNDYFTHGKISVKGADLVDQYGEKFQLIGISTHGLQWFGRYVNRQTINALKNTFGINVFRLSLCTAEGGYCESVGEERERLYQTVAKGIRYATEAGLYVIVDWHMVGAEDDNDKNPLYYKDLAMEFFSRISEEFKDYDNILYEIMNEPNGPTTWTQCKTYANLVIPKIRENTDGIVLVGNPHWTANLNAVMADPLEGYDNIMYTYHFYANGHTNTYQVTNAYAKGFPVFISEHGGMESDGDGEINVTSVNNWYKILDERNISYVAWNLSNSAGSSSIIKHSDDTLTNFSDEHLKEWGIFYKKITRKKAGLDK